MTLVLKPGLNLQSPTANDPLLDLNTQPSLDLQFATSKTLDDRVSGFPLVNHQRDASSGKSAGTYVGSDGLIKTSPVNLLYNTTTYSNWINSGQSIQTNAAISPSGLNDAVKLVADASAGGKISYRSATTTTTNVCSVYVKAGEYTNIQLRELSAARFYVNFDLSAGTYAVPQSGSAPAGGFDFISADIQDVGNGWYRCIVVNSRVVGLAFSIAGYPNSASVATSNPNFTGDGTSGVYIWGAQVEEGSTATDYIPTTTTISGAPRFDHDPVTGESLGLLIEESRTNLLQYSEQFDQSVWAVGGTVSVVPNSALGPNGLMTADQITLGSTGARIGQFNLITTPGQTGTASVYLKNIDHVGQLTLRTGLAGGASYNLNLSLTSEWVRYELTTTHNGTQDVEFHIRETSANPSGSFLVFGAQLEEGSFPTSYIPTTSSTVTRAADVASIEGTNFSSWFTQNTGTVFVEASLQSPAASGQSPIVSIDNSGADFRAISRRASAGARSTSNADLIDVTGAIWDGEKKKIAATWVPNDCALVDDGVLVGTDTSTNSPLTTVNQMQIGQVNSGGYLARMGGHMSRLTYYPYRLADATLQEITS